LSSTVQGNVETTKQPAYKALQGKDEG